VGWTGALLGGAIGYLSGLFFKSGIGAFFGYAFTKSLPTLNQYLIDTFIPAQGLSTPDFLRFFTVPLPFALLGAALGVLIFRNSRQAGTSDSSQMAAS